MATLYSDALVKWRKGLPLRTLDAGGKCRLIAWDFAALPAGTVGDVLVCGRLRAGDRVLVGRAFHSALGARAAGCYGTYAVALDGLSLGPVDDAARFLGPQSFAKAGQHTLADQESLGVGRGVLFEVPTDAFLALTNTGAPFATGGRVAGYLITVAD